MHKPTGESHPAYWRWQPGKMITGTAFVDMSAAYDTVNHRLLIQKIFNITQASTLCRVIQNLLSNRMVLNNERSRWRLQNNGLPLLKRHWVNSQSTTETTVCVLILTRPKSPRFNYGTEREKMNESIMERSWSREYYSFQILRCDL